MGERRSAYPWHWHSSAPPPSGRCYSQSRLPALLSMKNRPSITLSPDVETTLQTLVNQSSVSASVRTCGEILLYINRGRMPAPAVARTLKVPSAVVQRVCERFVAGGLKFALESNLDGSALGSDAAASSQRQHPMGQKGRAPKRSQPSFQPTDPPAQADANPRHPVRYAVQLDPTQQQQLQALTYQPELPDRVIDQLEVLLLANAGCEDEQIAQRLQLDPLLVLNTRQLFAEGGLQSLLSPALLETLQVQL